MVWQIRVRRVFPFLRGAGRVQLSGEGRAKAANGDCRVGSLTCFSSLRCGSFPSSPHLCLVSRSELLYLKNLFIYLCATHAPATASSSSASLPVGAPQLNQSHSSAALASPNNLELMSLRLPRPAVIKLLLGPAFPALSSPSSGSSSGSGPAVSGSMLERFYACFDYHGYGSSGLDYSEFLVMLYTLWYASPHEELERFLFGLCDISASGRVNKKEYRKVAAAIWADQAMAASTAAAADAAANSASAAAASAAASAGAAQSVASGAPQPKGKAAAAAAAAASAAAAAKASYDAVPLADREWITALFDFYFHLACYHVSRRNSARARIAHPLLACSSLDCTCGRGL